MTTHDGTGAAVSARDLTKSFGPVTAVDGVDLEVQRGEAVALLGPNGAGKTTAISMLLGLVAPDRGGVRLFGESVGAAMARGRVGAVLQDGGLVDGVKVRELLAMLAGLYPNPLPVVEVMRMAQVETLGERLVNRLSGGQAQRVRVAAALVGNPDLLVLDEPTVALDVEGRRAFWATMKAEASAGRTVLFSTHYMEEADAYASRVVMLGGGRILADGTPASIKRSLGARTVAFTLPGASPDDLLSLPGSVSVELLGERAEVRTTQSDVTLRALLERFPAASDVEVTNLRLEDAFVAITAGH